MVNRWAVDGAEDLERLIPGFDPFRLGKVEELYLDFRADESLTVRVRLAYWMPSRPDIVVELAFHGVRQMKVPELGSSVLELSELEVKDIGDRGLEGIQREVLDHGPGRFSLLCRQVQATAVSSRDGDTSTLIWVHKSEGEDDDYGPESLGMCHGGSR